MSGGRPGEGPAVTESWRSEYRSGISKGSPIAPTPLLALLTLGLALGAAFLTAENLSLRREVEHIAATAAAASYSERELSSTVARQHLRIRETEGELEMVRLQMEAVEMQLDGVDYLSRELREELGLPPSAATWSEGPVEQTPQGGAYAPSAADTERLALLRRRLAAGMAELYSLRQYAESRAASGAAEEQVEVEADASTELGVPANWPARGPISSEFGWRVFRGRPNYHTGIDIALPYGTQVMATGHGTVVGNGWQPGYGWSVLVQHADGYFTLYAHLAQGLVDLGDHVAPGEVVALSGSSGNSTGPHLHYEVWHDGQPLDPRPMMDGPGTR